MEWTCVCWWSWTDVDRRGHGVWVDAMTRLGESEHHTTWNMSMMDASTDTVDGITALYDE